MPIYSDQVAQLVGMQNQMFLQQAAMGAMSSPGPIMSAAAGPSYGYGSTGDRVAGGLASFGTNIAAPMMMGLGAMIPGMGRMLNPAAGAWAGAVTGFNMMGGGAWGAAAGGALGVMGALPALAIGTTASMYSNAFMGGVQNQLGLNQVLRDNFSFYGGGGAGGRGFGNNSMLAIGNMMQTELQRNLMTSSTELNQVIAGGVGMGAFTGVRDVQQFSQRFRQMVDSLRTITRELGGSLAEAQQLASSMFNAGVLTTTGQSQFAGVLRSASASSGMSVEALTSLAGQGATLARSVGGMGFQGATGAVRTASSLGAGVRAGIFSDEMMAAATGGLTGTEGVAALTTRLMERNLAFTRTGAGRYAMAAFANANMTGLDEDALDRFRTGDISIGEISRMAHRNVARNGRARFLNQEGVLRASFLEDGGLSNQLDLLQMAVGTRMEDVSDERMQYLLRRRGGYNIGEARLLTHAMRNRDVIRGTEGAADMASSREAAMNTEIAEHHSMDALVRNIGSTMRSSLGLNDVERAGRRFVTNVSNVVNRVTNELFGIAEARVGTATRESMARVSMGLGNETDFNRLNFMNRYMNQNHADLTRTNISTGGGLFGILSSGGNVFDTLRARGVSVGSSMRADELNSAVSSINDARRGVVLGSLEPEVALMMNNREAINRAISIEANGGSMADFYAALGVGRGGVDANVADAAMSRLGITNRMAGVSEGGVMAALSRGMRGYASGTFADSLRAMFGGPDTPLERDLAFLEGGGSLGDAVRARREGLAPTLALSVSAGPRGDGAGAAGALSFLTENDVTARRARAEERKLSEMERGASLSREGMDAFRGSEEARGLMMNVLSAGSSDERRAALDRLQDFVSNSDNTAIRAMTDPLMRQLNAAASEGPEALRRYSALAIDETTMAGWRAEATRYSNLYSRLAGAGSGREGRAGGIFGEMASYWSSGEGDIGDISNRLRREFISSDESREDIVARLRSDVDSSGHMSAESREMLTSLRDDASFVREARGEGRRGRVGAAEAALSATSGGTWRDMEFTVNGRTRRYSSATSLMSALGSNEDLRNQYLASLEASGVGASTRTEIGNILADGITPDESLRLAEIRRGSDMSAVRRANTDVEMGRMDPVGFQQLQELRNMNGTLTSIRNQLAGGSGGATDTEAVDPATVSSSSTPPR